MNIELSPDALPPAAWGSDAFSHHYGPGGSKRHEQYGADAAMKLLASTVDQIPACTAQGWTVVDLNPNTGELAEGFLVKKASLAPSRL